MSNKSHTSYKKKSLAQCREMAAAKKAAGLRRLTPNRSSFAEQDAARQWYLVPDDTRSITAHVMGDPIPGDPRCPWRPSSRPAA